MTNVDLNRFNSDDLFVIKPKTINLEASNNEDWHAYCKVCYELEKFFKTIFKYGKLIRCLDEKTV